MAALLRSQIRKLKVLPILAALMLWAGWADAAFGEIVLDHTLCHAVAATPPPPGAPPPQFDCTGKPEGYQKGSLWLRMDLASLGASPGGTALLIRNSRFDRVEVSFTYADGRTVRQDLRSGAFGAYWRAGGQIEFDAPVRDSPLRFAVIRFDRLTSAGLLRMRLMSRNEASMQAVALSTSVAAALTLLLVGALYNLSLAISVRRSFPKCQAAWAGCMFLWGVIWSQLHLFILPKTAGAVSAQICTGLGGLAVTLAAFAAVTAVEAPEPPRLARRLTLGVASLVALLGIPLALMRSGPVEILAETIGIVILITLTGVTFCLYWGWRHHSVGARTFVGAWSIPVAALIATQYIDVDTMLWGGGSQLVVLSSAAWQTLWLNLTASRTHARLRLERDKALTAEAQAHELARRDPLTSLRNRRGFIDAVTPMLEQAHTQRHPIALLLIDVDTFKRINDTHGHDAGDMVLTTIARRIDRWEGRMCKVARLGGEEFALMADGLEGFALARFAESVRLAIAQCDHKEIGTVTVSIGVAQAGPQTDFRDLYQQADEALYRAKRQGRNRVMIHGLGAETEDFVQTDRFQAAQ